MDHLTLDQEKALKALRADRLGYLLMGLILGGCMIGAAVWGFFTFDRLRKLWAILLATGCLFVQGGVCIWKDKTRQIRELYDVGGKEAASR